MTDAGSRSHGGAGLDYLARRHPHAPRPWIDLSTGINPFPYPCDGLAPADWTALPSPAAEAACRAALAACLGAVPDHVLLLPGSQAAISLLPSRLPRGTVHVAEPTYNEHAASWRLAGHAVSPITATEAEASTADVLVLTNPNNPDGAVVARERVLAIARERTAAGRWLVVDEAFADLVPALSVADACEGLNLVVLRSFGKFFGLAGLRLGAAVAPPGLRDGLASAIGPWAVSGPALAIGARAYADIGWQRRTRAVLAAEMARLRAELAPAMTILGGTDLFVMGACDGAASLFEHLARGGVHVRRFRRNPRWLRFGLPPDVDAAARLRALLASWTGP